MSMKERMIAANQPYPDRVTVIKLHCPCHQQVFSGVGSVIDPYTCPSGVWHVSPVDMRWHVTEAEEEEEARV